MLRPQSKAHPYPALQPDKPFVVSKVEPWTALSRSEKPHSSFDFAQDEREFILH